MTSKYDDFKIGIITDLESLTCRWDNILNTVGDFFDINMDSDVLYLNALFEPKGYRISSVGGDEYRITKIK